MDNNKTLNTINHPNYYNSYPIEAINMAIKIWGVEKMIDVCYVTAFFYRMRAGKKDDINIDLAKEQWWINKAKELEQIDINNKLDKLSEALNPQDELHTKKRDISGTYDGLIKPYDGNTVIGDDSNSITNTNSKDK